MATTWNTPIVDGPIHDLPDSNDWQPDELFFEDPAGDSNWGPFNDLQGLWVTWDENGLYVGVSGQLWDTAGPGTGGNSVNVYLDVDFGRGTGISNMDAIDPNALGAVTRNLWRPLQVGGGFGADFGFTSWAGTYDRGILDLFDPLLPVNLITDESRQVGVNQPCLDPTGPCQGFDKQGNFSFEFFIPWHDLYARLYPNLTTTVPPGAAIALVVNIVGGGDSMSEESIPSQSTFRVIDRPVTLVVDADADGVPDRDWPPSGSISGTVNLSDPADTTTVVDVVAWLPDGTEAARDQTPPGGGAYQLTRLGAGDYTVGIESIFYVANPQTVQVGENQDVTGIDFDALRVRSGIDLRLRYLDGPESSSRSLDLAFRLSGRTDLGSDFSVDFIIGPQDSLVVGLRPVPAGDYHLSVVPQWPTSQPVPDPQRSGYTRIERDLRVPDNDGIVDLGTLDLKVVRPTQVAFFAPDETGDGERITADFTTVSLPSENFYAYLVVEAGFVDDEGNEAIYGLPGLQITTTTMDPAFATQGVVELWSAADTTRSAQPLADPSVWLPPSGEPPVGRARFLLTDDAQEVVRLFAAGSGMDGVLEVGVQPIEPAEIALSAQGDAMVAGAQIPLQGRLLDVAGNPVFLNEFLVFFDITPNVPGVGPSLAVTASDGSFGTDGDVAFTTTVSGDYTVQAKGTTDSGKDIVSPQLAFHVAPDLPYQLELVAELKKVDGSPVGLSYRVRQTDRFENSSPATGVTVQIQAGPPEIVASAPASVVLDDADATGTFDVQLVPGRTGVVECTVTVPGLARQSTTLRTPVLFGLVATDEVAPESDTNHNANPDIDLTALYAFSQNDTLVVKLPFRSNFNGAHMALLLESTGTPEGAVGDYFGFPIFYLHDLLPDFVFTYKYAADDYADLRRPPPGGDPSQWQWYDMQAAAWVSEFNDNVNAKAQGWVSKDESAVTFRIPLTVLGGGFTAGRDTLRAQVYVMQEDGGEKRPALDSVPHDATVDMVPPPGAGEWWENLPPRVDLKNWAVFVPEVLPGLLSLEDVAFDPPEVTQGETTLLTARPVIDVQAVPDPIFQVFADFSRFGGDALTPMDDEGRNGDLVAGDGIYSVELTIDPSELEGDAAILVQATELNSGERASATADLAITGQPQLQPILSFDDPAGDDHGPNHPGEKFLYYTYPTNGVFFPGVFDLLGMQVFDAGEKLVFRVDVGEVTDPAQPDAANWNAPFPTDQLCPEGSRIDLNLQNVVVLIDNIPGKGSIKLPDNRWADVARQDAWDYAVIADGWWKGMVRSNGSSSSGSWDIFRNDEDYFFCVNAIDNTIDMFVDKKVLEVGGLSGAELQEVIDQWDFIVLMSGHDGDSNDNNWGGIRWVNEGRPQWQFGGGKNGESGRERDANIIDIMTHAGLDPTGKPKPPGRPQEEQLDFTTPEAERRFSDPKILVSVELEAEELIDNVPPQITFLNDPDRALRQWAILKGAPVSPIVRIEDDNDVVSAKMRWRGVGEPRSAAREAPLGLLRSDLDSDGVTFIGDVPFEQFSDPSVTNLVSRLKPDGTIEKVRYMILSFEAVDRVGNATPQSSTEYLLEVPEQPVEEVIQSVLPDSLEEGGTDPVQFDLPEGSRLRLPRGFVDDLFARDDSSRVELRYRAFALEDLDLAPHGGSNPSVLLPENRYLQAARSFQLFWVHGDSTVEEIQQLPESAEFSIHFPHFLIEGESPPNLQYFHYSEASKRWVLVGGHSEVEGSTLTAEVVETGLYGVFTKGSKLKDETLVTGLQLSPNPFSPNGDGVHDFLNISYVIPDQINQVVVEIYDLRGEKVRTLQLFEGIGDVTNRTTGLVWDGRDERGNYVPMGIYVCRVEVEGKFLKRWERATAAVVVVR